MIKSELITQLYKKQSYLPLEDIEQVVNTLVLFMAQGLSTAERIEIRGFGSFSLRHREPRIGRNPRTGETVSIAQKHSVHFKTGLELAHRVRESAGRYKISD